MTFSKGGRNILIAVFAIGAYFLGKDITTTTHTKDELSSGLAANHTSGINSLDDHYGKKELHRPVSQILNNSKLPAWVKNYVAWHQQQRQKYFDDMRANNTSDVRFLISRCFKNDNCGGTSDRLQDMPYNLMLANQTNRVLLVRWERPTKLEHYLVPQPDGVNWTAPDDMFPEDTDWNWSLVKYFRNIEKAAHSGKKILSTIRHFKFSTFREYEEKTVGYRM